MSTIELDAGREGAERLVQEALRRTEGVQGYRSDGDTFVVQFSGMGSFGKRLAITFDAADDGSTNLSVRANRTSPFAFTANPWRQKDDFLAQLRAIREDERERAHIERGDAPGLAADGQGVPAGDGGEVSTRDNEGVEPIDPSELRTLNAVKILLAVLLVVLAVVLVAAWVL